AVEGERERHERGLLLGRLRPAVRARDPAAEANPAHLTGHAPGHGGSAPERLVCAAAPVVRHPRDRGPREARRPEARHRGVRAEERGRKDPRKGGPPRGLQARCWTRGLRVPERRALPHLRGMNEIAPGVLHWTAVHPNIKMDVSSYFVTSSGTAIDPLLPDDDVSELGDHRPELIVLTNRHHTRSCEAIA